MALTLRFRESVGASEDFHSNPSLTLFEVARFAVFSSENPTKYKPDAQARELIGNVILAGKTSGSATISLACAAGLYQMRNFKTYASGYNKHGSFRE